MKIPHLALMALLALLQLGGLGRAGIVQAQTHDNLMVVGPELPDDCISHPEGEFSCDAEGKSTNEDGEKIKEKARNLAKQYCKSLKPPQDYVESSIECHTTNTGELNGVKVYTVLCTSRGTCSGTSW